MNNYTVIYSLTNDLNEIKILGPDNSNLKLMEELFNTEILLNHSEILVDENIDDLLKNKIIKIFAFLEKLLLSNISFNIRDIIIIHQSIDDGSADELMDLYLKKEAIVTMYSGKTVYPKTLNQALYLKQLYKNDVVFGIGPAGTGKTFLAISFAVNLLKHQKIKKIVLVRPAVEAGEKLGFLPGDLKEKVDPYLIPLYDALNDCFGKETVEKMVEKGIIEIAPLAYMRGRTLDNSVIILDEAQNTTTMQMKMFLTRLGFNSKMIITGDVTQIDLPVKSQSGLVEAMKILDNLPGISIVKFNSFDVMRNPLVFKIINRYNKGNNNEN